MSIRTNIDATIAELVRLREAVADKHDEQASEYKAMHRRISAQRTELARLNDQTVTIRELRRAADVRSTTLVKNARMEAERITSSAHSNIATAWRELALERMRPNETEQGLKLQAMHRALAIGNRT